MNRELLARVRDRIAEVGNEHCDMASWAEGEVRGSGSPECGTTACIAGWTVAVLDGVFTMGERVAGPFWRASEALGLNDDEAEALFYEDWPPHYQALIKAEGDAKGMLSLLDAILDGRVIFNDLGELVDLEAELADEVEEMAR